MNKIKKFFCRLGIHRPMKYISSEFTDTVSGESVCKYKCHCGNIYLSTMFSFFRVNLDKKGL